MNSWKTIDLSKQYGSCRLLLFTVFTIMMSFVLIYTLLSVFSPHVILYDDQTMGFFSLLLLLYPVHKLLHYLPMRLICKKVKTSWSLRWHLVLTCKVYVHHPIRKNLYLITLVLPFFIMSFIFIGCAVAFPHYTHYFTIFAYRFVRVGFHLCQEPDRITRAILH